MTGRRSLSFAFHGHGPFVILVTLGGLARSLTLIAYEPALLLQSDAYVYIQHAVDLEPAHFRPVFYSLFLWPFVQLSALQPVVVLQHLLGLGMGVAIYFWLQTKGLGRGMSAAAAAPVLLDAYQVNVEHHVLAETLFQALALAPVLLVMTNRPFSAARGVVAGALLGAAALTRFVGAFLIVPVVIYLVWKRVGWAKILAATAAFAAVLLVYASWFLAAHGVFGITDRQGLMLYGRVATWVRCSELEIPGYLDRLCDPRAPEERPGGNFYVFGRSPVHAAELPEGVTREEAARTFAASAIRQQPRGYLGVVLRDTWHYMLPGRRTGRHDGQLRLWRFPTGFDPQAGHAYLVRVNEGAPPPQAGGGSFQIRRLPATWLRSYQSFAFTQGPLVLGMLLASLAALVTPTRCSRVRPQVALLLAVTVLLLVVPVATVQFDYRFLLPALVFLPPAAAWSLACLIRGPAGSASSRDQVSAISPSSGTARDRSPSADPGG